MSNKVHAANTFVYWFFFVSARDLNRAAVRSTANKAIVWLCLARGFHRLGMSNRVHAANTFVYWFFFVSARDLNRAAVRSTANKAIVWLCLARGFHRLGMSNKVHAANTFVYWFFFVSARDLQQRRPLPAAETGRSCWGRVLIFQSPVKGLRKNQQTQPVGRRRSDDVTGPTG